MTQLFSVNKPFNTNDLEQIHNAAMRLLQEQGIVMDSETVLAVFKRHGFKVHGARVFFTEQQVLAATESAPAKFDIRARNPEKNLHIGDGTPVLCGTGGEVYIAEKDKSQRLGTMADYRKIAKLVQTSPLKQMTAHESVHPHDVDTKTSHLDMMWQDLTLCDVAATSNTQDVNAVKDCLAMLGIIFGGKEKLQAQPATLGIISPLSPLQYAPDQAEALMVLANHRQPAAITNMLLLGSSAPVFIPGALALGNAELLAGVVLSQLVSPGTPVIYGSTSCPLYMRNGASCLGTPETLILSKGLVQLAKLYHLPSRTGGALCDAHIPDGQAMAESALCLNTAIESGADYILHAFGMLSSYLATSLEKWLMDEEMCRFILASRQKVAVTEKTIAMDSLLTMGAKGEYLTHPDTFENFRSLYQGGLGNRDSHEIWMQKGGKDAADQASELLEKRLAEYKKPSMDNGLKQELKDWIVRRKQQLTDY